MIGLIEKLLKPFNNMLFEDVVKMALAGEYLSSLLDEYLDVFIEKNNLKKLTDEDVKELRDKVIAKMQEKYPSAGITPNKK